jgi:hypothetical protein
MPTHSVGNLIVGIGTNDNASIIPTKPADWTLLWTLGATTSAIAVYYKYAQSNAETFGTWTNADHVSATVWSGSPNTIVWPWLISQATGTSTNMNWPAQVLNTFRTDSEDNALLAYGHNRSATNNLGQTLGALTNLFEQGDGANYQVCTKYQLGRTTTWANTVLSMAASVLFRTVTVGLTEQTGYGFTSGGSGGLFLPIGFTGGMNE